MRRVALWAVMGVTGLVFAGYCPAAESWDNPPRRLPAGMEHRTFLSQSMHTTVGYNVSLPAGYRQDSNRRFPVIYYLHGYEGNESSYLDYARFWDKSPATNALLVFVNGGATSFFSDAPDGSIMAETLCAQELVHEVDSRFRTIPSAGGRSLHGYSMGGFGALKLAFKYPDTFGSVVAYGATLSTAAEMQKHLKKVFNHMFATADRFAANDPLALLRTRDKRPQAAVCLIIGSKDEFLGRNRELAEELKHGGVKSRYLELRGVKHDKDALYEGAAFSGFEFTAEQFSSHISRNIPTDKDGKGAPPR